MKHIKLFESKKDIEDLQINLDELMWGNIDGGEFYYVRYSANDSRTAWFFIPLDPNITEVTNDTLKEYLINNEVPDVLSTSFKKEIENGFDDNRLCFLLCISFTKTNTLFVYFDGQKNFLFSKPIEISKVTNKHVLSNEKGLCYDVYKLFKEYEFGGEKFGQLDWNWFKDRFELKLNWI